METIYHSVCSLVEKHPYYMASYPCKLPEETIIYSGRTAIDCDLLNWNVNLIVAREIDLCHAECECVVWKETTRRQPGLSFNINMSSYQYRKSLCGDKMILRPSYLHNGISYTGKMASLYWIRAQYAVGVCPLTMKNSSRICFRWHCTLHILL